MNYSGGPGAMEVEGALMIWRQSAQKHKLYYMAISGMKEMLASTRP